MTAKKKINKEVNSVELKKALPKVRNKKVLHYGLIIIALLVIGGLFYLGRGLFIAAMVNGKPISRFALDKELEKQGGKQTLDDLISKTLISAEAKKAGITITNDDVQKEIQKISDQVQAQGSTLDAALAMQGATRASLEENIRIQKTVEGLLKDKLVVSDEETKSYYDQNQSVYGKDSKFEDLKDQIKQSLAQQKLSAEFKAWMDKLKSEAGISYFVNFQ
jgi:foldase protein PrsA